MIESHAQRSLWPLTVIAILGSALIFQACSGKVQGNSDCASDSSCGGAAGGNAAAGSGAVAASAASSGAGSVTLASCENNSKDGDESDVDCGGASKCQRCPAKDHCISNEDCESDFCKGNRCTEPTCSDRVQNQDETGVDCGGSCPACDLGYPCSGDQDCSSEYCADGACADHCLSGVRESNETDTDCGGDSCKACADHKRCLVATDCQSRVCDSASCQSASCSDQLKNQDESDVDCGGVCGASKPCAVGAHCNTPADCASGLCSSAGKCLADILISPADVIDDFEDGDGVLPASPALGGRVGIWSGFGDGSGSGTVGVDAIKRGASSVYGLHVSGRDFNSWGSGVAVDLNKPAGDPATKAPYDATGYTGITFWARAESPTTVTVALPDADTDAAGETCTTCDHHYYKTLQVTTNWQRFTVAFSGLVLEPGSAPPPTAFKPSGVVSLQFRLAPGQNYDLYLDDLAFLKN